MNILLLSPLPPPAGGIASWTKLYVSSESAKLNIVEIVDTKIIGDRAKNRHKKNLIDEIKRTINIINNTSKILNTIQIDVAHVNTACSSAGILREYICIKIIKSKKVKILLQCHCNVPDMIKSRFSKFIFRKILKLSNEVLVLNTDSKNELLNEYSCNSKFFPNFINKKNTPKISRIFETQIKNILYVGNVCKSKGCIKIIEVAKQLEHIQFTLAGQISDEIKNIAVPENVLLTGALEREEVLSLMKKADLFLFLSYSEGFPLVILEAMQSGLPIVSTKVGAIPDILPTNGGIIVQADNLTAIINAIETYNDFSKREIASRINISEINDNFTTEKVTADLFGIYKNMIK
jgi:glycosyltransferase involved in cell wall biosynthesis